MTSANGGEGGGGVGNGSIGDMGERPSFRGGDTKMGGVRSDYRSNVSVPAVGDEEAGRGGVWDALSGLGEDRVREGCCKGGESGGDSVI